MSFLNLLATALLIGSASGQFTFTGDETFVGCDLVIMDSFPVLEFACLSNDGTAFYATSFISSTATPCPYSRATRTNGTVMTSPQCTTHVGTYVCKHDGGSGGGAPPTCQFVQVDGLPAYYVLYNGDAYASASEAEAAARGLGLFQGTRRGLRGPAVGEREQTRDDTFEAQMLQIMGSEG